MASEKQRHNLIAQLAVVHLTAIFILRLQQHGKQIALIATRIATLTDDAIHNFVDFLREPVETSMSRRRQAVVQYPSESGFRSEGLDDLRKSVPDVIDIARHVRVEQGARYNFQ